MIELTPETVPAWLASQGLAADPRAVRVRELPLGVSNRTFWADRPEGPLVVKQARAKLAVAMEWLADVRRIVREAEAMDWLHARIGSPAIPRMLALDRAGMVLAMEAILPPAENYKTLLLAGEVHPGLAEQWGALLARIHSVTQDALTRERFADATFFDQLRMSPYYDTVAARHPDLAARLAALRAECMHRPYCLVHGDYSAKNMLVRPVSESEGAAGIAAQGSPRSGAAAGGTLILLDFEVAHFGNPSFDIAFALTDYLMKALHLPRHAPALLEAARRFWAVYQSRVTVPPESRAQAGSHLAAVMLARVDGKSPFEYFTVARRQIQVRDLTRTVLREGRSSVDAVIAAVAERV
jgi:aminoglycoside phosphotransferase (APT) family kinase protein